MRVLIILLSGLFIFFFNDKSVACSCIGTESVKNAINKSRAVFVGEVVSIEKLIIVQNLLGTGEAINRVYYRVILKVDVTYKGKIKKNQIELITGIGKGDCGFHFDLNKSYVVYAESKNRYFNEGEKVDKFWYTDICKRTTYDIKSEKEQIEKYRKPCR